MKPFFALCLIAILAVGGYGYWQSVRDVPAEKTKRAPLIEPLANHVDNETEERTTSSARTAIEVDTGADERELNERLSAWNENGIALLEAGSYSEAIELFEKCLEERPDVSAYLFNVGEALMRLSLDVYQEGERLRAIELLARAVEAQPDRDDFAKLLAGWRATDKADDKLWQYENDHFELVFDSERSDLLYGAQDVLDVLETAYIEYTSTFGVDPIAAGRVRIRVVLTSRSDFARATGLGEWAGGAYDGTIRLPLADLKRERTSWTRVLRHELAHVWMREMGGAHVPGWLNEGICQWIEGDRAPLRAAALAALEGHKLFTLSELTGSLIHWDDPAEVRRAYAQAFLFLEALMQTYGMNAVLAMANGCDEKIDPSVSFERATLVSLSVAFDDFVGTLPR
ncbi:MAG: tetratricopeptide (TPR) repeat protein [Planctomycetota bacterium]|jgi:tetratricopeptide (TPR) repeat protein